MNPRGSSFEKGQASDAIVQIRIDSNVNAFDMPEIEKFVKWYDGKY